MIIVMIRNDGTGNHETGNYDIEVQLPGKVAACRVEGFNRRLGYISLLRDMCDELEKVEPNKSRTKSLVTGGFRTVKRKKPF